MVSTSRTSRLLSIKEVPVILMQTDTTVGFSSQDAQTLYEIKSRETSKPFITVYQDFKTLLSFGHRVPHAKKNLVRRSKKTTFIVKNKSFRIAKTSLNSQLLKTTSWYFSSSANASGKKFDREFCEQKADIIIEDKNGLSEKNSSKLYKINNYKRKKLR